MDRTVSFCRLSVNFIKCRIQIVCADVIEGESQQLTLDPYQQNAKQLVINQQQQQQCIEP